jgi:phenylpropionate dioxygenase-like ring-hydroxylating dioxygenase large terminal subunit
MYPFKGARSIVRNRWYIAAFAHEITRQPLERAILGIPVLFYRTEAGAAVAMYGLCPHRYFPLAQGKLQGDSIVCGYHGFTFAANGKCVNIPSQGTGAGFSQPTYRLEERGPLCWIWMGDADRCDPERIPPYDQFGLGLPGWRASSFNYFHVKGRPQLLVDNLMDLTHLPYVHHHIPGGDAMSKTAMVEQERPRSYQLVRKSKFPWTPFHDLMWGPKNRYEGLADFDSLTEFYGPEFIQTGMPIITAVPDHEKVPPALGILHILHGITPETAHSTHYFGFSTRNFRVDDEELDKFQLDSDCHIRQQDCEAIESVEKRLDQAVDFQRELLARSDAPAIKVRQKIQAMLDAEA